MTIEQEFQDKEINERNAKDIKLYTGLHQKELESNKRVNEHMKEADKKIAELRNEVNQLRGASDSPRTSLSITANNIEVCQRIVDEVGELVRANRDGPAPHLLLRRIVQRLGLKGNLPNWHDEVQEFIGTIDPNNTWHEDAIGKLNDEIYGLRMEHENM